MTAAARKDPSPTTTQVVRPRRDTEPSRMLRALFRCDPFRETETEDEIFLAFEVKQTRQGFHVRGELPGVEEGDLSIRVTGNRITIAGKRFTLRS